MKYEVSVLLYWELYITYGSPAHGHAGEGGEEADHDALALHQHQVSEDQTNCVFSPKNCGFSIPNNVNIFWFF